MLGIKLPIMRAEEADAEAPSALWRVTGGEWLEVKIRLTINKIV